MAPFSQELEPPQNPGRFKATFISDFKRNELDQINDDIHDVADRVTLKKLNRGELTIQTVKDYCDHMIRCGTTHAAEVMNVLNG